MREAHAAIEPWTAAEAADHRNLHRGGDRSAGDRAGIGEIEETGAGAFQKLCLFNQSSGRFGARLRSRRILRAVWNAVFARSLWSETELREHRNTGVDQCAHNFRKFRRG